MIGNNSVSLERVWSEETLDFTLDGKVYIVWVFLKYFRFRNLENQNIFQFQAQNQMLDPKTQKSGGKGSKNSLLFSLFDEKGRVISSPLFLSTIWRTFKTLIFSQKSFQEKIPKKAEY